MNQISDKYFAARTVRLYAISASVVNCSSLKGYRTCNILYNVASSFSILTFLGVQGKCGAKQL